MPKTDLILSPRPRRTDLSFWYNNLALQVFDDKYITRVFWRRYHLAYLI